MNKNDSIEIAKAMIVSVFAELKADLVVARRMDSVDAVHAIESRRNRLESALKELDSCESSANCSGTTPSPSGPPSSPPSQAPVTDSAPSESVSAAATPAKLSWLPMAGPVPRNGFYYTRASDTKTMRSSPSWVHDGIWYWDSNFSETMTHSADQWEYLTLPN